MATTVGQYCIYDNAYVDVKPGENCPDCGRPTETVTEENYFFKLSAFQKPLLDFYGAGNSISSVPHWWDFGSDGTLSLLAQDDNSLKRITITLPDSTSIATMLGGSAVAANH